MIKTFKHEGLEAFFTNGSKKRIKPKHERRLREQLAVINTATIVNDINIIGYNLQKIKGSRAQWSISIDSNWRLTFEFVGSYAHLLNYEDCLK